MNRHEAIALLELMKQQQRSRAAVPPLDGTALAKAYVRMISRQPHGRHQDDSDHCAEESDPPRRP